MAITCDQQYLNQLKYLQQISRNTFKFLNNSIYECTIRVTRKSKINTLYIIILATIQLYCIFYNYTLSIVKISGIGGKTCKIYSAYNVLITAYLFFNLMMHFNALIMNYLFVTVFMFSYLLVNWAKEKNNTLSRKNPKDYENDT